jgi:predicted RNA-binding Zn-ribbon protein involved in translation (DUF1610 family)
MLVNYLVRIMKKTTDEQLRVAVANSTSVAEALRSLGLRAVSGSYSHYSGRIKKLGLDTSHHKGRGNFGHSVSTNKTPASEILVKRSNGRREHGVRLRRALIEIGRSYACEECGLTEEWRGNPLTLDVDHINQDWMDDRAENLRFLCPNCHSQFTRGQVGQLAVDKRRKTPVGRVVPDKRKSQEPHNKGVRNPNRAISISDEELKNLVWSMPLMNAAKQFDISDVALKKECKIRGIQTPPRGHWIRKNQNSV